MQFERNLILLRKKNNLSQEELAFAVGVSRQTIYTWEAGLNYPNILMLKKLAEVLNVTTDDLLNGFEVNKLPKRFSGLKLTYVGKHPEKIYYDELPNWFIKLKKEEEVSWGLYDPKNDEFERVVSYHIDVKGDVIIHDLPGIEIEVKEYDENLSFLRKYDQYVSVTENGVAWIGATTYDNNKKELNTYKDQKFLDDWGYDKKLIYMPMNFYNGEDYVLEFNGQKQNVIIISYFDPDGSDDLKCGYFEVILNENLDSLGWRRYKKKDYKISLGEDLSNEDRVVDGITYNMDYYALTSRL